MRRVSKLPVGAANDASSFVRRQRKNLTAARAKARVCQCIHFFPTGRTVEGDLNAANSAECFHHGHWRCSVVGLFCVVVLIVTLLIPPCLASSSCRVHLVLVRTASRAALHEAQSDDHQFQAWMSLLAGSGLAVTNDEYKSYPSAMSFRLYLDFQCLSQFGCLLNLDSRLLAPRLSRFRTSFELS